MKVLVTFEVDIPESEVSELNDVDYEVWRAVRDAGPCWPDLNRTLQILNEQGEPVGRLYR